LNNLKYFISILFLITLIGCTKENLQNTSSQSGKKLMNNSFVEGKITVVGNEPFTVLGLQVNDSTVYKLDCNEKTKNLLLKNQGELYKIYFTKKTDTKTGIKLEVTKTEKIKK